MSRDEARQTIFRRLIVAASNRVTFSKVLGLSLCVGSVQLGIAAIGGLHIDVAAHDGELHWFGYVSTAYWCVGALTTIPIGYACGVVVWNRLLRGGTYIGRGLSLLCGVIGVVVAGGVCGRDMYRSFYSPPGDYCQWNHLVCEMPDESHWELCRSVLYGISMTNFFGAFSLFTSMMVAVTIASVRARKAVGEQASRAAEVISEFKDLLMLQKFAVMALLFYYVLLRTSKVEMLLVADKRPITLNNFFQFAEYADPYLEAATTPLRFDIIIVAVWVLMTLFCHRCLFEVMNPVVLSPKGRLREADVVRMWLGGYDALGPLFALALGASLVGIMLPPPSRTLLLQFIFVAGGVVIIKRALDTIKQTRTNT